MAERGRPKRRFEGRIVIVVGGGGGMGEATAVRLADEGAAVAVCDIDGARAETVAHEIGGGARAFELDVRDAVSVERVFAQVEVALGPVDGLALTSGIFESCPFLDSTDELWEQLFSVNVFGAVRLLRAVGASMRARRSGSIVVVASQSAKVIRLDQAAYGASKAALTYAAKTLGLELAPHGVRVNVVQPGVTESALTHRVWGSRAETAKRSHIEGDLCRFRAPIPLGKIGQPEEIAAAVAFLLSDDASHVALSELLVDGGSALLA